MNFSHYLKRVDGETVDKFIFAQGNKPAAQLKNGQIKLLSEVFLFKDDLDSILTEVTELSGRENTNSVFYLEGGCYQYESLKLADSTMVNVYPINQKEMSWGDFLTPGYINDWLMSETGLLVFYGADKKLIEEVRLSFVEQRIQKIKGSSLAFSSTSQLEEAANQEHFLTSSIDEQGFLNQSHSLDFDSYFFKGDLPSLNQDKILKFSDRGSFVVFNSFWSQLSSVWSEIENLIKDKHYKKLFVESIIGFIGVKKAESADGTSKVVFEVLPFTGAGDILNLEKREQEKAISDLLKKEGVSFNQSLHSLIMKRKVSLESAYKVSPDPEELNLFLAEAGV